MTAPTLLQIGAMQVVAVRWWTGVNGAPILPTPDRVTGVGLVVIRVDPPGALKAYIGVCYESSRSERADIAKIANGGCRVHDDAMLRGLFPHLADEDWYPG